ncbi:MAG: hypothetical protein H7A46_19610 [Verrucomicrobiales bacterium]|nr:hypothetical protein [Verrucomicrobiales bacterium]
MFLRCKVRRKGGKEHRTWSIVENRRVRGGRVVQRHVLYLGEINSSQREAWRKSIEIFEEGSPRPRTASLFPEQDAPENLIYRMARRAGLNDADFRCVVFMSRTGLAISLRRFAAFRVRGGCSRG